ncbi:MAG: autorepressor SdpR family transcription factor [Spirochaetia bacterium]|nr:autorepressor SdpR family transcription factor [Spirochaetia bacterium]
MNDLFKALADPSRRKILKLLKDKNRNAGDILSHFEMKGSSLNHHLEILKQSGLVMSEKKGQNVIYSINTTVFQELIEWVYDIKGAEHETK